MKTIEIEKKVRLSPQQMKEIAKKGSLLKEFRIQDSYFDTHDYRYTSQNMWLRQREGTFELKVGIRKQNGSTDQYEEITDEKSILKYLGIKLHADLTVTLSENGLQAFCSFVTWRKSYQLDELKIDIDEVDFGDLKYQVAEIELIVSDVEKIQEAEEKISEFMQQLNIDMSIPVPAKLTFYLYHKRPKHYQALVQNKVISSLVV